MIFLFCCGYDVVSLMTFQGCYMRCLDLPNKSFKSLESVFFDFLHVGVGNRRSFHHICSLPTTKTNVVYVTPFEKLSSSESLHVSAAFPFLNKSRFDHSSCFFQAWFWDRFDIVCASHRFHLPSIKLILFAVLFCWL